MTSSGGIQEGLREVMRLFPQGVTVVTTRAGGVPRGITVSAFTSVSLDPPLVLVSISKNSEFHPFLTLPREFAVNFLAANQQFVSERFAGRHEVEDMFEGIGYAPGTTGSPVIRGARAIIECRAWKVHDVGDHSLLIGEVVRAEKLSDDPPLVYYIRQYTTTEWSGQVVPSAETIG